ncbi:hypothetical protein P9112_008976 [Eukaryota sp. TZLM1-RC]
MPEKNPDERMKRNLDHTKREIVEGWERMKEKFTQGEKETKEFFTTVPGEEGGKTEPSGEMEEVIIRRRVKDPETGTVLREEFETKLVPKDQV